MRLFKKRWFIVLFITLFMLILIGLTAGENNRLGSFGNFLSVPLSPFQKIISATGDKIGNSVSFFKEIKTVREENYSLKARIDKLEKDNRTLQEYKEQNKVLKDTLNIKDQFSDYNFNGANIIAKDMGNWFNVFAIDAGTKDGISSNMSVITGKGLVGRIKEPFYNTSKVISIIDEDSTVSGRITKSRDVVRVRGDLNLKNKGQCRMDYIDTDVDVSVGDVVETSGLGGIFPKGIIIGKVKEIRQTSSELSRYAVIEPAVDFKRLEEVFVLSAKSQ